jgi:hypothetical protein
MSCSKVSPEITRGLCNSTARYDPKRPESKDLDTYSSMFSHQKGRSHGGRSVYKHIHKTWSSRTLEYYSAIKRNMEF